jgi:hypothetical protein
MKNEKVGQKKKGVDRILYHHDVSINVFPEYFINILAF